MKARYDSKEESRVILCWLPQLTSSAHGPSLPPTPVKPSASPENASPENAPPPAL